MKNEIKNIAVKSAKLAGVTCVAAGAIALVASGAAVKAVAAGGKYLKEVAQKILEEDVKVQEGVEAGADELPVEEAEASAKAEHEEAAEEVIQEEIPVQETTENETV